MWRLRRCELLAREDEAEQKLGSLDTFRHKMQQFGVFDRPWPPPVEPERLRDLGYEEPRELHRALNAARYFDLVAGMSEDDWYAERMKQELERPRGRLHLLVGPAASGKSSWAEDHLAHTAVVSSDRMRRELIGDPADQSQNYLVFQRCMDRVRERLRDGEEVTFDATNYDERLREMPVQAGRWCAAEIVSYFFDVGVEEALRRNRNRPREVPEDVVLRHYRRLQPPALYEADRHCVVAEGGEVSTYWPVGGV
jgi:predicted kinase